MSWPLSHTADGLAHAARMIDTLPVKSLREAAVGWKADMRERGTLRGRGFNVKRLAREDLVAWVTEQALGEHGRCSNGGQYLYVDPEGWITVPLCGDEQR